MEINSFIQTIGSFLAGWKESGGAFSPPFQKKERITSIVSNEKVRENLNLITNADQ
jgi:hypothetical protein